MAVCLWHWTSSFSQCLSWRSSSSGITISLASGRSTGTYLISSLWLHRYWGPVRKGMGIIFGLGINSCSIIRCVIKF